MSSKHAGESLDEWCARIDARYDRLRESEHVVYRAFDEYGHLLYVGCTVDVNRRMSAHRSTSAWVRFADRLETESFVTMAEARTAEKLAIDTEGALFNATQADINRTQANRNAAHRSLSEIGIFPPRFENAFLDDERLWEIYSSESGAYDGLVHELRAVLKSGGFPYLTDADRVNNYLSIRESAIQVSAA